MAWPTRTYWSRDQARQMGRRGGKAPRQGKTRGEEYKRGYQAGWRACERFWRQRTDGAVS
jgi:hypothetical protein